MVWPDEYGRPYDLLGKCIGSIRGPRLARTASLRGLVEVRISPDHIIVKGRRARAIMAIPIALVVGVLTYILILNLIPADADWPHFNYVVAGLPMWCILCWRIVRRSLTKAQTWRIDPAQQQIIFDNHSRALAIEIPGRRWVTLKITLPTPDRIEEMREVLAQVYGPRLQQRKLSWLTQYLLFWVPVESAMLLYLVLMLPLPV